MNDEKQFLTQIRRGLDAAVEGQSPALQGRLRAVRREALAVRTSHASRRYWVSAFAASLMVGVVTGLLLFQGKEVQPVDSTALWQTASGLDQQILHAGEEFELFRDLEFYYWLEQEQLDAG